MCLDTGIQVCKSAASLQTGPRKTLGGAFWGSARVGFVRGAGLAHLAPLPPLSSLIDTPIILVAAIPTVCRDPPRAALRGVLL